MSLLVLIPIVEIVVKSLLVVLASVILLDVTTAEVLDWVLDVVDVAAVTVVETLA
jgi:hypothetical protein